MEHIHYFTFDNPELLPKKVVLKGKSKPLTYEKKHVDQILDYELLYNEY